MKKTLIALCTAVVIFACNVLTPATVCAAENGGCTSHTYGTATTGVKHVFLSSHQYLIENGPDGPIYGTCYVYHVYYGAYPQCTTCGALDYDHPVWEDDMGIWHSVNH